MVLAVSLISLDVGVRINRMINGKTFNMEKLDPRLAAIILLLYIRYLPGMLWERISILQTHEKVWMQGKKENESGDSGDISAGNR